MYRVFLVGFEIVTLLALLATNLISINKLYKFLRKAIKIERAIKDSKLDILDKIVRWKVREEFRDLEFRYSIDSKSIIESIKLLNRSLIDLVIIK